MYKSWSRFLLSCALVAFGCANANAHSIWIETVPTQNFVSVHAGFGEAGSWDRVNARKIEGTKYRIKNSLGEVTEVDLQFHPRSECFSSMLGKASLGSSQAAAVYAEKLYGVAQHGTSPAWLVTFTAKAYYGAQEKWSSVDGGQESGLEVIASRGEKGWVFEVRYDGKSQSNVQLTMKGADGSELKGVTDSSGKWEAIPERGEGMATGSSGAVRVLASYEIPGGGSFEGKEYVSKRHIATLTIPSVGAAGSSVALQEDEAAAKELMQALQSQSHWKDSFAGVKGTVTVTADGKKLNGSVTIPAKGAVELVLEGAEKPVLTMAQEMVDSLVWHRASQNTATVKTQVAGGPSSSDKPARAMKVARAVAATETDPTTVLVPLDDPYQSRFWIRNGQLAAAFRIMGDRQQSINILDAQTADDGHVLPTLIQTTYWNSFGELTRTEIERRQWTQFDGHLVPASIERMVSANVNHFRPTPGKTLADQPISHLKVEISSYQN